MRLIFWCLLATTIALYMMMGLWSLPLITQEADGLLPFDLRPFGYSPAQAGAFLNALSDEGRVFYLETQRLLDMIFPATLAVTLIALVRLVFRELAVRLVLSICALVGATADYLENAMVAMMLRFEATPPPDGLIIDASRWTMLKSACDAVVMVALVLGFVAVLARRWMPR